MRTTLALVLAVLCGSVSAQVFPRPAVYPQSTPVRSMDKPAFTEADAFQSVAAGMCGTLGLGTGLVAGRGWLHQPIPGPVELRLIGSGTITRNPIIPPEKSVVIDMEAGRPYMVIINAPASSRLIWKVPGHEWGLVPVGFQLPPAK